MSNIKDAEKKTEKTESGIEYQILKAPPPGTKYKFEFKTANKGVITSPNKHVSKRSNYDVSCEDIRTVKLPLDSTYGANPREPSAGKSDVVMSMQDTLAKEQPMFILRNGGITIVCSDFEEIEDPTSPGSYTVSVEYNRNEGIVNGGHTYFSIENTPVTTTLDSALVNLEIIAVSPNLKGSKRKAFIVDIAHNRNRNREIDSKSSANSMGLFNRWKKTLGKYAKHVRWKSGDSKYSQQGLEAEEFIRTIMALDVLQFSHDPYNNISTIHKNIALGGGSKAHDLWYSNTTNSNDYLEHLVPLTKDIMELRDFISWYFTQKDWIGTNFLPLRMPQKPNMNPLKKTSLWGTAFGDWIRKGSLTSTKERFRKTPFIPPDKGYDIPATIMAMILGMFRSCIWVKNTKAADGNIGLIGWYENPKTVWAKAGVDIIGSLAYLFSTIPDTKAFVRLDTGYMIDPMEWAGKSDLKKKDEPVWFYDLSDKNKKYVQEDSSPTHYLTINPVDARFASLEKGTPPSGCQGYKISK